MKSILKSFILSLLLPIPVMAQAHSALSPITDARGEPELTICSQNLANYSVLKALREKIAATPEEVLSPKEAALIKRIERAHCDVIAVQELIGKTDEDATSMLEFFALLLQHRTNRFYEVRAGQSYDKLLHVGYLVAKDRAKILNTTSYVKVELPKLTERQKPRFFSRGPLEIQLEVAPHGEGVPKIVTLINFHLKSKAGGGRDPAGLQYETYRMEAAEALRRISSNRHASAFKSGQTILVLLGDRNSHFDSASAKILEGVVTLKNFQKDGPCRLSKRGVPLCLAESTLPQQLFSVLTRDPQVKNLPGTFAVDGVYSWLDDILLPQESLRYAEVSSTSDGDYNSGLVYEGKEASDHAMVWVRLNW